MITAISIREVFRDMFHYVWFKVGSFSSLLTMLFAAAGLQDMVLAFLGSVAGLTVAFLSAYKILLEIRIKKQELKGLKDLHDINNNQK